jgi:hypothetical protein
MKSFFAALFATTAICLLTACAGTGGGGADGSASAGSSSLTVFGTLDAGVSSYKNR